MAITDLTNTTWEIPAGWTATAGYGSFLLQGPMTTIGAIVVDGVEYLGIEIGYYRWVDDGDVKGGAQADYINGMGFSGFPALGFDNNSSFTISFIKGEDYETYGNTIFTNPQLISWLEANGTLQGGSEPVTIKAGTYTWNETIPQSGWCSGTTVKSVMFNFKVGIGYNKYGFYYTNIDEETYTTSWTLSDTDWLVNRLMGYTFSSNYWSNGGVRTFTVETDQEVTGDDPQGFMDYLTANSDYGSQSEPEQTDTKPIYKRVNGAWVKLTAFERVNGAWVKISSAVETEEPEQPQEPENCLTFSSPSSFTLGVYDNTKHWNGTLEYSTDGSTWTTWAGTSAISSSTDGKLYMRGIGNTYITGSSSNYRWVLTGSNISCNGNIETLLDYATVANGGHPTMADYCYRSMFYQCTSLVTAPALPATTLTGSCYAYMFYYCSNLTTAPELPATTLENMCYISMFQGCTQIKLSTTQTGDYQTEYRIPSNGTGTTATFALQNMFSSTGGTFTGTPTINTTYYTSNTVV